MRIDAPLSPLPQVLQSKALKCPHGFSTRIGGISKGIFESLNFGNPGDLKEHRDTEANIHENFVRVLTAEVAHREIVQVHQVHGNRVHIVRAGSAAHEGSLDTQADAMVTDDPARVLAVRVADCAPVLLESGDGRIVAAVHAGWRGAASGIASAATEAMRNMGARDIRAAIGPCIGAAAFEVGPEVLDVFELKFSAGSGIIFRGENGKGTVDLKRALVLDLQSAGVMTIEVLPHCTVSDAQLFFSHRREGGMTGRMIGFIGPRRA